LAAAVVVIADVLEVGTWVVAAGAEVVEDVVVTADVPQPASKEINNNINIKTNTGENKVFDGFNPSGLFFRVIFLIPP
jgi:hypothetical protein